MPCTSYEGLLKPSWCPGCSFFTIRKSLNDALFNLGTDPLRTILVSGIGCSSRLPLYSGTFGMHTLHGRALPFAIGAHCANPDTTIVVTSGDGDLFSIGIGHFVHAARNDFNITVICFDNNMYAMTRNQSSPTSALGHRGSLTPSGVKTPPLNVLEFAIVCKATFVARSSVFTPDHVRSMIERAIRHNGFSFVEIIAPCKTFDRQLFGQDKHMCPRDVNCSPSHEIDNYTAALHLASRTTESDNDPSQPFLTGIFYETTQTTKQ